MTWRPQADAAMARARAAMLDRLRRHFRSADVMEVGTPVLGQRTVTDASIRSVAAAPDWGPGYLQTSPEYFMKRMLAAGYPDIYQVCPVFRDGESGRRHATEFTMVEWYRHGYGLEQIIDDAIGLAQSLLQRRQPAGVVRIGYADAFEAHAGIDPLETDATAVADALGADADLRTALGDDRDAWLDLALATRIAPQFAAGQLTVLHHFPATQAALARLDPGDPRVAERFELFVGDIEIANGFVELADAAEQRRRFDADGRKRRRAGLPVPDVDEAFLAALDAGLPDCAGVALGLDRVLMIEEGRDDIRQVQGFTPGRGDED
jgi:lysyl-tRNA synthetase class 2